MMQSLWKTVWQFLKQLNIEVLYDPKVSFLGRCARELKICAHTKDHTQEFIAASVMRAKHIIEGKKPV